MLTQILIQLFNSCPILHQACTSSCCLLGGHVQQYKSERVNEQSNERFQTVLPKKTSITVTTAADSAVRHCGNTVFALENFQDCSFKFSKVNSACQCRTNKNN